MKRMEYKRMRQKKALIVLLFFFLTASFPACSENLSPDKAYDSSAYLDLGQQIVTLEELIAILDARPELKKVDMYATVVEKSEIEVLTDRYPCIDFGWTIHIPGRTAGHTVRTDQTAFSTLHGNCITHTSADFDVLRYCTELRALDLGHNVVDDLSFLEGLTKLRVLILACNKITDISPLAGMKELEYVELFSNPISDLSPLYDLPHLMDINAAYLELSDPESLYHFPAVQRLWVSRCMKGKYHLKKTQLNYLRSFYPEAVICSQGEPTEGGWRRHPHYSVMMESFRTGIYIPFEDSFPLTDESP